ncbi:MAG: ABC transporter ATP-binding protein [Campylobacterales bacterium]
MIEIKNLSKKYGEFEALKNIDLMINRGERVLLKGPSGSGKSTLLSIIAAISKPTSGGLFFEGTQISALTEIHSARYRRDSVGFVFQDFNLLGELSVKENCSIPLLPTNISQSRLDELVVEALKKLKLEEKKDIKTRLISGGEKQRCAIARAIVGSTKILLADEPTANLDLALKRSFEEILFELKDSVDYMIVASHDEFLLDSNLFSRTIELKDGEVIDTY